MHGLQALLLLLHSSFMLSVVKTLLKGEVGGHALNIQGNYIVDHGKSWNCVLIFLWEPCIRPLVKSAYQNFFFFISQPKHMLWVLKRINESMRRFF